jgi:hypothetical protein
VTPAGEAHAWVEAHQPEPIFAVRCTKRHRVGVVHYTPAGFLFTWWSRSSVAAVGGMMKMRTGSYELLTDATLDEFLVPSCTRCGELHPCLVRDSGLPEHVAELVRTRRREDFTWRDIGT